MWRSFFLPGMLLHGTNLIAQRVRKLSAALVKSAIMVYPEQGREQRRCR